MLVQESVIRQKYEKGDWDFLVNYVKQNWSGVLKPKEIVSVERTESLSEHDLTPEMKQFLENWKRNWTKKTKNPPSSEKIHNFCSVTLPTRFCPKDKVKRVRLVRAWGRWHDMRVCPICWDSMID